MPKFTIEIPQSRRRRRRLIFFCGGRACHLRCICYNFHTTKSLQEAIETLRALPEEEQDAAADAIFAYISSDEREYQLQPHQTGKTRLATDDEVAQR